MWEACNLTRSWNDPNKDINRKLAFQAELFFVGEIESQIIASAMAGYDGHRGSVFYLAIKPELQNSGYGRALTTYIENVLSNLGCPKVNIAIRTTNLTVIDFYSSRGYAQDDVINVSKRLISDV